jgi:DNA-directed RNA polymerase subunit RPC12/RpoP
MVKYDCPKCLSPLHVQSDHPGGSVECRYCRQPCFIQARPLPPPSQMACLYCKSQNVKLEYHLPLFALLFLVAGVIGVVGFAAVEGLTMLAFIPVPFLWLFMLRRRAVCVNCKMVLGSFS